MRYGSFGNVAVSMLKCSLDVEPTARWTCSQLLDHPYFDQFRSVRALSQSMLVAVIMVLISLYL